MEPEVIIEAIETMPAIDMPAVSKDEELRVYLIVNTDLKMGLGKTGIQIGHAVQYLLDKRDEILAKCDSWLCLPFPSNTASKTIDQGLTFNAWKNSSAHCKIALAANTAQFQAVKDAYPDTSVVVVDAGRTEIPAGSETVIGLYPIRKSDRLPILVELKPLK